MGGVAHTRPLRPGGLGVEQLISAPVFAIEFVSLFFARALFVWFYNRTGYSVLLVAIFHASFDAAINQLSDDVVPGSNTPRFLIFSAVIVLAATTVIIATRGQLGRRTAARSVEGEIAGEHTPDDAEAIQDDRIRRTPEIGCRGRSSIAGQDIFGDPRRRVSHQ